MARCCSAATRACDAARRLLTWRVLTRHASAARARPRPRLRAPRAGSTADAPGAHSRSLSPPRHAPWPPQRAAPRCSLPCSRCCAHHAPLQPTSAAAWADAAPAHSVRPRATLRGNATPMRASQRRVSRAALTCALAASPGQGMTGLFGGTGGTGGGAAIFNPGSTVLASGGAGGRRMLQQGVSTSTGAVVPQTSTSATGGGLASTGTGAYAAAPSSAISSGGYYAAAPAPSAAAGCRTVAQIIQQTPVRALIRVVACSYLRYAFASRRTCPCCAACCRCCRPTCART